MVLISLILHLFFTRSVVYTFTHIYINAVDYFPVEDYI